MMTANRGDKVRVLRVCSSVADASPEEFGNTIELFRRCVGNEYRVEDINEYGQIELYVHADGKQAPDGGYDTIWVEPENVELVAHTTNL